MSAPPLPEVFGNYALGDFAEVVPPEAISWLPQTTGWLWLGIVLLAVAVRYSWRKLVHWYRNRYRREATEQLRLLNGNIEENELVTAVNRLLKLVALAAFSRERVAKLSGKPWTDFLNQQCDKPIFSEAQLSLLATGSYQKVNLDQAAGLSLLDASEQWIIEHRGTRYV